MDKHSTLPSRETKSVPGPALSEVSDAFGEFMEAFDAFKEANDERLKQLEQRKSSDVITEQKLRRIDADLDKQKTHMDELVLKNLRPSLSGKGPVSMAQIEHKQAFDAYMRGGHDSDLRRFEAKAMSYGSDPDGGYLVPDETSNEIGRRLSGLSPIRSISSVRTVTGSVFKKPFSSAGPATGWVAETDVRPETAAPSLSELQFPTMELYAMPAATSVLLDDAAIDLDVWIAEEVEVAFSEQESSAFVNGDGINKPTGFLTVPTVDESVWSWGNIGYRATGTDGAFDPNDSSDGLVDTIYSLKSGYRQNAQWVMNRKTQAEVRKLKDADGIYLWQAPASPGAPASLMGFPLTESEDMPDIGSDSLSIAFGDFRRGYLVVDRSGIRVLRDPYSSKPYVLFYTTKRVGGGVQDFDAIKLLKFGTA